MSALEGLNKVITSSPKSFLTSASLSVFNMNGLGKLSSLKLLGVPSRPPISEKSRKISVNKLGFVVMNTGIFPFCFAYLQTPATTRPFPIPAISPKMNPFWFSI